MKKFRLQLLTFFASSAFLFANSGHASLLIDPYAGYAAIRPAETAAGIDSSTESGTFIGARVGYQFLLFSAGVDVSTGAAAHFDRSNTALFVGVDLPILFRFWAEHTLSSDLDSDDASSGISFDSGYSLGVGFTGLPLISLNAEFEKHSYEVGGQDFDVESFLLSVSLPLNFF